MTRVDIDVSASGPWFDGRARAEIDQMIREAEYAVAAQTYSEVMQNLNASIKHPTPYYETQITNERLTVGRRVHDRGIAYGPWLEGTDPRNRTTRFPGYHSFRRAWEKMNAGRARELVEQVVARYTERM